MKKLKKLLLCINFLLFVSSLLVARFEFNSFSPETIGKGGAGLIDYSIPSIYYNPANFIKEKFSASFSIANSYGIDNFYTRSIGLKFHIPNKFNFGYLFIIDSPFIYYQESLHLFNLGFNYSDFLYAGLNFRLFSTSSFLSCEIESDSAINDINDKNVDMGIIVHLRKDLKIGISAMNIFNSDIVKSYIRTGIQFFFSEYGYFNLEYKFNSNDWQNIIHNGMLYLGVENRVFKFLILRAGLFEFNFTLGAGLQLNRFMINYSFYQHQIGISNSISINFRI